ncbi:hypothetical protein Leryth_016750, partial [Lithospermum erythrorhizon]
DKFHTSCLHLLICVKIPLFLYVSKLKCICGAMRPRSCFLHRAPSTRISATNIIGTSGQTFPITI